MIDYPQSWFSVLGEPLGESEREDIAAWLRGLGLDAGTEVQQVGSWEEASSLTHQATGEWWMREEAERKRLEPLAKLSLSDRDLITVTDTLHGAAAVAAARAGNAEAGLIKAAAGAAFYAVYQHRIAQAAGEPDTHPFTRKYALFAGGRWPLGLVGGRYAIF